MSANKAPTSFIKADNGKFSSSRVAMLWGLLVGGVAVLAMAFDKSLSEGIFLIFMGASGGVYSVGKYVDGKTGA